MLPVEALAPERGFLGLKRPRTHPLAYPGLQAGGAPLQGFAPLRAGLSTTAASTASQLFPSLFNFYFHLPSLGPPRKSLKAEEKVFHHQ